MSPPSTRQVSEIATEPDRAVAYARLLHLQRGCADDPSSAADLAAELPSTLLPLLIRDVNDPDEAVAASALKCLGFTLYHPVLLSTISGTSCASLCTHISSDRTAPLLTAIIHALDNQFGSFSTTFEAAQIVASDLEQQLLSCMMNMLDDPCKKVQAVNSWGWIISLLGSSAISNRPLLNKLLKVPEQMFVDHDLQVQLATMHEFSDFYCKALQLNPKLSLLLHNAIVEELDHTLLASEKFEICLDIEHIKAASQIFLEGLYEHLVTVIDENMSLFQANLEHCSEKLQNTAILSTLGEVLIGLLQNGRLLNTDNQELNEPNDGSTGCRELDLSISWLKITKRFMKLSSFGLKANPTGRHHVTNRVFKFLSASVGNLILKKDILLLFETIGDQLFEWLSLAGTYYCEMQQGGTIYQLERLWIKIVERLKMSQLINDDSFLSHQKLLQAALNHTHHPISMATASIWRPATSSSQQHPACLASKLDELLNHRPKDLDNLGHANKIVHERIDVSRRFALPLPEKRTIPSNETEPYEVNGGILKISVGLGRKRLKITKYPTKPKELGKNVAQFGSPSPRKDTTNFFSPCCMESKVCRKPELILEMLRGRGSCLNASVFVDVI
ncbi:hypothetical protein PR202_gb08622 [Eleusine coracana subsp. coracana]|uniref:Telomere-associated protein Rif1 N-terminal domain-containing protein n=1 Tax=Eleusine coracana subsp. coracana TaxID=191504 RepID=A0AAV5EEB2_ELECO|nr:hypothetical protein PR202_gb08622 [Eleusine coracana subsp. coracana]